MKRSDKIGVASRFFIFFLIGLALGVVEDIIAIRLATDAVITWHVVEVAFLVALPFAVLTELVVDMHLFRSLLDRKFKTQK